MRRSANVSSAISGIDARTFRPRSGLNNVVCKN